MTYRRLVELTGLWWFSVLFNWWFAVERLHSALYDSWWYAIATVLHLWSLAISIKGLRRAQAQKRLRKELAYLESVAWLKEFREPPYN